MSEQLLDRRYSIVEVLSQGGFGRTFLAKDTKLPGNPICVVKQLHPVNTEPELLKKAQKLFTQEAEILQPLGEHPQIPRLLAYFEERGEFYIVQEYILGHTLVEELIADRPLLEEQVIQILLELLKILEFVHSNSVIHRDIKPGNIIRNERDNKLVLIDFGAVKKALDRVQEKTIAIGTPAYIPIEQFHGEPNFSSDIYAVGMIGIQAITGIKFKPYIGGGLDTNSKGELIWRHYAQVGDRLGNILTKMVRYNYRDRYQSATEALQTIQILVNARNTTILIPHKKTKNSFKLSKIFLIYSSVGGGVLLTGIIAVQLAIGNSSSQTLLSNGKLVKGVLNRQDICDEFLEQVSCKKYYLKGKSGQQVNIEMNSDDFDPYLVLCMPDGKKLEVSEDISLDNWNSKITVNLPMDGNYTVIARTSAYGESGNYSLRAFNK